VKDAEDALAHTDLDAIRAVIPCRASGGRCSASERGAHPPTQYHRVRDHGARARRQDQRYGMRRLADPDPRAGLTRYASLSPEERRRVRETTGLPYLDELEHLLDRRSDPDDAVTAIWLSLRRRSAPTSTPRARCRSLRRTNVHSGLGAATRLAAQLRQRIRDGAIGESAPTCWRRCVPDSTRRRRRRAGAPRESGASASSSRGNVSPSRRSARTRRRCSRRASLEASYERLLQAGDPLAARGGRRAALGARRRGGAGAPAGADRGGEGGRSSRIRRLDVPSRRRRGGGARSAACLRAGRPAEYQRDGGRASPLARCRGAVARPVGMLRSLALRPIGRSHGRARPDLRCDPDPRAAR
jgi:hypothetical protein